MFCIISITVLTLVTGQTLVPTQCCQNRLNLKKIFDTGDVYLFCLFFIQFNFLLSKLCKSCFPWRRLLTPNRKSLIYFCDLQSFWTFFCTSDENRTWQKTFYYTRDFDGYFYLCGMCGLLSVNIWEYGAHGKWKRNLKLYKKPPRRQPLTIRDRAIIEAVHRGSWSTKKHGLWELSLASFLMESRMGICKWTSSCGIPGCFGGQQVWEGERGPSRANEVAMLCRRPWMS